MIGGLIVLALTVALVGPYFVDWTSYRADFEREASRILGRDVKVEGTASARLLPFPSVTFSDVTVAGVEPGETAVTIETFSMDAELAPFLSGEVLIFDMRLVRPVVQVDIDDAGGLDWAVRPSVPVDAHNITLEKLTISEGKVNVRHAASGRTHSITELNADVSARALTGPWRLDGSMRLDGMKTAIAVSTGSSDDSGSMRIRVRAEPERYPLAIETDGTAQLDEGGARYEGTFKLAAGTVPETDQNGQQTAAPYRARGTFDLDHEAFTVGEFLFETGSVEDPYTAEGTAEFVLGEQPRFLVTADGAQIRFDDLEASNDKGMDLDRRLASLREFLLDMPKPGIPGRVAVNLPAIVAGDTMVRDVRLLAEPSAGGWSIASVAATLPGRATLEAKGELGVDERLDFTGSLLLAIGQPSGFAAWLSKDVDEPIRRLPAAGFSANVELSDERQVFRDLELVLGAAKFRGEIESLTPAGAEPSMSLTLDGDALDVEGMAAFASLFVSDQGQTRLADRNLSFNIVAGPVSMAGLTADTLDTALRLRNDRLEIDRLSIGGLAGANISATGVVRNPGPSPTGNIDATVIAADLAPLADMLAERFPQNEVLAELARRAGSYPDLMSDSKVEFVASVASGEDSADEGLAISGTGQLGGTRFALTGSAVGGLSGLARTPMRLNVSAYDDDAGALFTLSGLPALPLGLAGQASLDLNLDGVLADGAATSLTVAGEGLDSGFEGQVSLAGGEFAASGSLQIAADDIAPWLATAGVVLPGTELGLPARLEAEADIGGGLLVLSGLQGNVGGASVEGDINAQLRDGLPHLTGALALSELDLWPLGEMAVGPMALQASSDGWPETPFANQIAAPFSADIDIAATKLQAGEVSGSEASVALKLGPDGIFLSNLRASGLGGAISGNIDFRNDAGTGLLAGQLALDGGDPAAVIGDIGIDGMTDASVTFTASGKSVGGIVTALAGSGQAAVEDLVIEGVNPGALPALLAQADKFGPEIDAAAISVFAPDLVRQGTFKADRADIAFTLANGVVRAPPLRLEGEGAVLSAQVEADIADGSLSADASLTFDAGREALVGSEPTVRLIAAGPPGDIGVLVDTEPLARFLTQRALELEQQRVEAMQAALLEKQRYRREARYYAALQTERELLAEAERLAAEEAERLQRELRQQEEQRRAAEEEAQRAAEEDARRQSEEEQQRLLDEEAERARQAEEARLRAEREAEERRKAEEERLRAEVEALLSNRPAPASTDSIERAPLAPPVIDATPQPRPSPPQSAAEPPAANVFSERNLSIEGLMRAIGEN